MAVIALLLTVLGWTGSSSGEKLPPSRGELRIVDHSPVNWVSLTLNVFEHLMEYDKDGQLRPVLATAWRWVDGLTLEVKLRPGVTFHNGERFDAEIVKLNWQENIRTGQPHLIGTYMNFKPGSRIEIVDPLKVRFVFPEPDGTALVKLAFMHIGNRQFYREVGWGEQHW